MDPRDFLRLPVEERRRLLAEAAEQPEVQAYYDSDEVRKWIDVTAEQLKPNDPPGTRYYRVPKYGFVFVRVAPP